MCMTSNDSQVLHYKNFFFLDLLSYQTQEIVTDFKKGLAANFYDECIQNMVQRCNKCLYLHDNYME